MINLSIDQTKALQNIDALFKNIHREQILTGSPGAGKSFLTAKVIEQAKLAGYQLILAATTHPAAKVLADFTGYQVITLHKLLDLKVINDYVTNTTHIEQHVNRAGPMIEQLVDTSYPVLAIVDEASYIDDEINSYIEKALIRYPKLVILYVGDQDQLPPVGSETPHVFTTGKPTSILTTDHRYDTTSQMASIVKELKKNIQDKSYFLIDIKQGKDITLVDENGMGNKMYELYTSNEYKENPYYVKSMAYRNIVVDNINNHIRGYFYSEPTYQKGERLIVNAPLVRQKKVLANNGDIVTVTGNWPTEIRGVKGQQLHLETLDGDRFTAIVTKEFKQKSKQRLKLVKEQNWKELYRFMESFIEVKDMYASTIHKAQGATYNNVMLHLEDLVECQDHTLLARLLLVAVSRASEHVYVYGSVPKSLMRS